MRNMLSAFIIIVLLASNAMGGAKYDMAYYWGFVTTNGGSTLADDDWMVFGERGVMNDTLNSPWSYMIGNAILVHTLGNYTLFSTFAHDGSGTGGEGLVFWDPDTTWVFEVTNNYIDYLGTYVHTGGRYSIIPEKRVRLNRYLEVGEQTGTAGTVTRSLDSATYPARMMMYLQADALSVSGRFPDPSETINNCLRVNLDTSTGFSTTNYSMVLAPGRGRVINKEFQTMVPDADHYVGEPVVTVQKTVVDWNRIGPYYTGSAGPFTDIAEVTAIEAIINGLTFPTVAYPGSGSSVVIPMF